MQKIKIFLASSNELEADRRHFEIEIYRKCKSWFGKDVFLHLDIWEDLSAQMSLTGSQSEYNKFVQDADIFVLLAHTKVGMYTAEEFEKALGQFKATKKPFIFTYFKEGVTATRENRKQINSLYEFQDKLDELGHFYANFKDFNDLWNQFNKELDRLELAGFSENKIDISSKGTVGKTINQQADKIYNIDKIDKADFS